MRLDYLVLIYKPESMDCIHFIQLEQNTGWSKELLYQLVENVKDYAIFVSDLDGRIGSFMRRISSEGSSVNPYIIIGK